LRCSIQTLDFDRLIVFDDHGLALIDWLRTKEDPTAAPTEFDGTDLSGVRSSSGLSMARWSTATTSLLG
jgi:hypothetical protein